MRQEINRYDKTACTGIFDDRGAGLVLVLSCRGTIDMMWNRPYGAFVVFGCQQNDIIRMFQTGLLKNFRCVIV